MIKYAYYITPNHSDDDKPPTCKSEFIYNKNKPSDAIIVLAINQADEFAYFEVENSALSKDLTYE